MSCDACLETWESLSGRERYRDFDVACPNCCCESSDDLGLHSDELIAKLVTSPYSYSFDTAEVLWQKMIRAYSDGLSFFRPGCTEQEIHDAVVRLTAGGAEPQQLVGATLTVVRRVRDPEPGARWFAAYGTPALEFTSHADVIGRIPIAPSKTQVAKLKESRLRQLRNIIGENVVLADTASTLVQGLRLRGFAVV